MLPISLVFSLYRGTYVKVDFSLFFYETNHGLKSVKTRKRTTKVTTVTGINITT